MKNTPEESGALITVREMDGEIYADSRDIARGLGIQHPNFIATLYSYKNKLESKLGLVMFQTVPICGSRGVGNLRYALLTEDQASFLATLSRNTDAVTDFKLALVVAFRDAREALGGLKKSSEAALTLPDPTRKDFVKVLRLLADTHEEKEQLERENAQIKQKAQKLTIEKGKIVAELEDATEEMAAQRPMVLAYHDFLAKDETDYDWATAAKVLDGDGQRLGSVRLLKLLREEKVLMTGNATHHNVPYQKYVARDYFRVYFHPDYEKPTTVVTPKGMAFLSRKLAEIRDRAPVARRQLPLAQVAQAPMFPASK